jgi:nucleotide-binding universal stress UspA family protein
MSDIRVLVPLDGSALSEEILPVVRGLPDPEVLLVRVVEAHGEGKEPEGARMLASAAERDLAWIAERLRSDGVRVGAVVTRHGQAAAQILGAATDLGASLIAMTTHGRSGFDRLVLGSVAEKVIRKSPLPVLALRATVAPGGRGLFERVLLPYDGSDLAWRAVETVARLAKRATGPRSAILFGVVETFPDEGGRKPEDAGHARDIAAQFLRLRTERVCEELEAAAARARDLGIEAKVETAVGSPAVRILCAAEAMAATLIAIATHGRSGPSRWALGSVTEKVLRGAPAPLLICR